MTQYDAILMEVLPDLAGFKAELTRLRREESHFESYVNDCFNELVDISVKRSTGDIKTNGGYFPSDAKKQIEQIELLQIKYVRLQTKVVYDLLFSQGEQRAKINKHCEAIPEKSTDILQGYNSLNILKYKINIATGALGDTGFVTRQSNPGEMEAALERNRHEIKESYHNLKELVCFFYNVLK